MAGKICIVQGMINLADSACKAGALAAAQALGFPHLPFLPTPVPQWALAMLLASLCFERHHDAGYPSLPRVFLLLPCVFSLSPRPVQWLGSERFAAAGLWGGGQQGVSVLQEHPDRCTMALELPHCLLCRSWQFHSFSFGAGESCARKAAPFCPPAVPSACSFLPAAAGCPVPVPSLCGYAEGEMGGEFQVGNNHSEWCNVMCQYCAPRPRHGLSLFILVADIIVICATRERASLYPISVLP